MLSGKRKKTRSAEPPAPIETRITKSILISAFKSYFKPMANFKGSFEMDLDVIEMLKFFNDGAMIVGLDESDISQSIEKALHTMKYILTNVNVYKCAPNKNNYSIRAHIEADVFEEVQNHEGVEL